MSKYLCLARRSRLWRIGFLLAVGGASVTGALRLRDSRWAQERRLQNTDLPTLLALANEQPQRTLVRYYLGNAYFNADRLEEAAEEFKLCMELDPRFGRGHLGLGMCALKMRQPDLALSPLQRATELEPKNADAHLLLAIVYTDYLNSNGMALKELTALTNLQPTNDNAWYRLAECRSALSQPNEAIEAAQHALSLKRNDPRYHRLLGQLYAFKCDYAKAKTYLDRALTLDGSDAEAHYAMAKLYLSRSPSDRDVEDARVQAQRAVDIAPYLPQVHVILGEVALRENKTEEAVRHFREALKIDGEDEQATYKLADAYRQQGNMDEVRRLTDHFQRQSDLRRGIRDLIDRIKHRPKDPELRLRVARLLREHGEFARAANQYQVLLGLQPDHKIAQQELNELTAKMRTAQGRDGTPPPPATAPRE